MLDAYLTAHGQSGLFNRRQKLVSDIAMTDSVAIYLPGYAVAERSATYASTWDVLAAAQIRETMRAVKPSISSSINYLGINRFDEDKVDGIAVRGSSCVIIGSPRASRLSSVLLDLMFFPAGKKPGDSAPFAFIWPDLYERGIRSLLASDGTESEIPEILSSEPGAAVPWAFALGDEEKRVNRDFKPSALWKEYAVVCFQIRYGVPYLVLAGITGCSTYAASLCLNQLVAFEDQDRIDEHCSRVLWYPIECSVKYDDSIPAGDHRDLVGDPSLISGPHYWPSAKRNSRSYRKPRG